MAGKTRGSVVAALLQQPEVLKKAYEDAMNAEGSAWKENEKYMDSIQGKIDLFNNAVQTLWNNTLDDAWIKGFVDFGTEIVKLIDNVGMLTTALIALTAVKLVPWLLKGITSAETFGGALKTILAPLTYITGTKQTLASFFAQTAAGAMNAAGGVATFGTYLKAAGATLKAFFATPLGWFTIAATVIGIVVTVVDQLNTSFDEQVEKLNKAREEYEESQNTLEDLNNELETTKNRIKELQNLGTLTVTEKEELNQLKEYNSELERRIKLSERAKASEQRELAKEAVETYNKLPTTKESNTGKDPYKNYFDNFTPGYLDADAWNNFLNSYGEIEGASLSYLNILYDKLLNVKDEYIQSIEDDNLKLKFLEPGTPEDVLNRLSNSDKQAILSEWDVTEVQDSISGLNDVLEDIKSEAFKLISDDESGYQALLDDMSPRYEQIIATNQNLWSDSDKKIVETYNAIEEKIKSIWMKYDPSEWIKLSSEEIWNDASFSDIYKKLPDLVQDGILNEEELRKNFDDSIINALIAACKDKGILLSDLLNDAVIEATRDAENEDVNESKITDTLTSITSLEDAFNSLGDAIKEFKEDGTASASTLKSLQETFSDVDGFEELYTVLATGEGDVEEAITNVANAYIAQKGLLSDLTDEELQIMTARLESLGVVHAKEILLNRQRLQQQLDDDLQGYNIDLSAYSTAEEAKAAITDVATNDICSAVADMEAELQEQYGINLSDFVSTEEAKVTAAKEAAKKIAEANKEAALSDLNKNTELTERQYREQKAKIEYDYENTINSINSIQNIPKKVAEILDSYYSQTFEFDFSGNKIGIGRDFDEQLSTEASDLLSKIQKKYENKIALLESQQTYLENEIKKAEAENRQVGKAVYDEQIRLEQQKISLYEQELSELQKQMTSVVEGSDEWYEFADAIWDVKHNIQESTIAIVDFKQAIVDLYVDAFGKIEEAFSNQQKLYEYQQDYIRNNIEYLELLDDKELISADSYKNLIKIQKQAYESAKNEAASLNNTLVMGIEDGSIKEGSKEWADLTLRIWESATAAQQARNEIEKINDELKDLYVTAFDKVKEAYDSLDKLYSDRQSWLDNYVEIQQLIDEDYIAPKQVYTVQIEYETNKKIANEEELATLIAQRKAYLDDGGVEGDTRYNSMTEDIRAVSLEIQENDKKILDNANKIKDIWIEIANKVKEAYDNMSDLRSNRISYVEKYMEYMKLLNEPITEGYYNIIIDEQTKNIAELNDETNALRKTLEDGMNIEINTDTVGEYLKQLGEGGTVDLLNRPQIPTSKLADAGWGDVGGDIATVYSNTYSNEDGTIAMNFTPILPNGDVLDPTTLQKYAEGVIAGVRPDDLQLQIGSAFTGQDAIDQAVSAAEEIHELQGAYYLGDEIPNSDALIDFSGKIEYGSKRWKELNDQIIESESAILNAKVELEGFNQELRNLYYDAFKNVANAFGNEQDIYDDQQSFIDGYIDYLETMDVAVPAELYEKKITIEQKSLERNLENLKALYDDRDRMIAKGFTYKDDELIEVNQQINDIEKATWDSKVAIEEWNKAIRDLDISKFEEIEKRINDIFDELENVYGIISKKDVAIKDGIWSKEGITSLALMAQKMELAKAKAKEYQKEIDDLNKEYKAGTISEQAYNDRLVELKNSQWDAINAYEDAKDAIIDINEARIDLIEDGINEEIDAYQELIDLKKKELDAERDLYDFRKDIQKQTKDIASLERKIAAMSGSTDAATIAERTKLQAQLRESREGLDDTYYSHAMDSQQQALDDENEAFSKSGEDYVKKLRENLKNVEQVVSDTLNEVFSNTNTIVDELNNISQEYNVTLSDALTQPWMSGSISASTFKTDIETIISTIRTQIETDSPSMQQNLVIPFEEARNYATNTFSPDICAAIGAVADEAKVFNPASDKPDKVDLISAFINGQNAANTWSETTEKALKNIIDKAKAFTPNGNTEGEKVDFTDPFKKGESEAETFGKKVEEVLKNIAQKAKDYNPLISKDITTPPNDGSNAYNLFGENVATVFNNMVTKAQNAATQISTAMTDVIKDAEAATNAISDLSSNKTNNSGKEITSPNPNNASDPNKTSKTYGATITASFDYDRKTTLKDTATVNGYATQAAAVNAAKAKARDSVGEQWIQKRIKEGDTRSEASRSWNNNKYKNVMFSSLSYHAKGTLGTTKDEWAITDEPQYGDELVLIPNKEGNLSYMRKGTSVVPADITENLMKWGQFAPNMEMSDAVQGINLMSNYVSKPILNLSFDALVKAEKITEDTLPTLKKFVTEELDKFSRNLNYSLRRVGAK